MLSQTSEGAKLDATRLTWALLQAPKNRCSHPPIRELSRLTRVYRLRTDVLRRHQASKPWTLNHDDVMQMELAAGT